MSSSTNNQAPQRDLWTPVEFVYGGYKIAIKRRTVAEMLARDRVIFVLREIAGDALAQHYAAHFARIVSQTVSVEGEPALNIPEPNAAPEVLAVAFAEFLTWDGNLLNTYLGQLMRVDAPPNDPRFVPPEKLSEDEKKSTKTNE